MGLHKFFSSLMSGNKQPENAHDETVQKDSESEPNFEILSFEEIITFIQNDESVKLRNARSMGHLSCRLLDLVYMERDVSDDNQQKAFVLYESTIKDLEAGLAHNENGLAALKNAQEAHFETIRNFGRGSLSWEISTPGLTDDEIYSRVIDPENSHLIPRFTSNLSAVWEPMKPNVIKKIIRERRRNGESNAVLIAAGLITGSDPVAWNIFTPSERKDLQNAALNYDTARQVLVKYKILPETSKALPFDPRVDKDLIAGIAFMSLNNKDESPWNDAALATHEKFNSDQQKGIGAVLTGLRMIVWLDTLEGLYGIDFANQVQNFVTNALQSSWEPGLSHVVNVLRNAKQESLKDDATIGWDSIIAAGLMEAYMPDDDNISEEAKMDLWRSAVAVYNEERVFWMAQARWMIRFFVNDIEKRKDKFELTESEQDIYMTFGAVASNIEAKSLYEDWIGTNN